MRLTIAAVGRLKAGPERALIDDWLGRAGAAGRAIGLGPADIVDDSSGCVTCCSMSSMFSTSRTTLVCTMEELTFVWYPIERLCR